MNFFSADNRTTDQLKDVFFGRQQNKREGKDQESIQPSTTPDPEHRWESDNVIIRHHKREPRGQPSPSRRPQGTNRRERKQIW